MTANDFSMVADNDDSQTAVKGDFVIVRYARKRSMLDYVGCIEDVKHDTCTVSFLGMGIDRSNTFSVN